MSKNSTDAIENSTPSVLSTPNTVQATPVEAAASSPANVEGPDIDRLGKVGRFIVRAKLLVARVANVFSQKFQRLKPETQHELRGMGKVMNALWHSTLSGFAFGMLLALTALCGVASNIAFNDFVHHVVYGHPYLWMLTSAVVMTSAALGDAALLKLAWPWFTKPVLSFAGHIFGAAVGAIPAVYFASHFGFKGDIEHVSWQLLMAVWVMSALIAASAEVAIVLDDGSKYRVRLVARAFATVALVVNIWSIATISPSSSSAQESLDGFIAAVFSKDGHGGKKTSPTMPGVPH